MGQSNSRRSDADVPAAAEEVTVLHLDDEEAFLRTTRRFLSRRDDIAVETTTDPEAALDRLEAVDCVVADYEMPAMDGVEFLRRVRERDADIPFILFTGKGSEEVAADAIEAGVTDYIQKGTSTDRFQVLANRVTNAVEGRRAAERAARKDREIRRVYERITDAFVALDSEWTYTYVNRQAAGLLETDPEALLGETVWESFPELRDTGFETELRRAFERQEPTTFEEYYDPLGVWFEVRVHPSESGLSVYFRDVTERRERQRRYEAVFEQTYQFTGLMEPDGTLLEANETALEFVGADREEVVGEKLWETPWFQYDETTRRIARQSVETARGRELYRGEFPIEGADGETIVIDYSVRPVTDETGTVELLIPEGRDITDLKERERQLREEQAFNDSLLEALPDVLYVFDESGRFVRWNRHFSAVTGYTDEEIAGMEPLDFVPDDETERIATNIARVLEEGRTVTVESALLTKDGDRVPYEFTGARMALDGGDEHGVVGIGRDISDRKARERRFEAIFDRTFQFTGLMEPDGTLLEASEAALGFDGADREAIVGEQLWETPWFRDSEETRRRVREGVERAADGEFVREEIPVGDEETAVVDFSIKPVYDDRGDIDLLIPEGRDITDLKERERQLERKNEQLQEFTSIVSHDLRTPLSVATTNIEMALDGGDEAFLEDARAALERMDSLVDELLELATQGDAVEDPDPVRLPRLLSDVETDLQTDVRLESPDDTAVLAEGPRLYSLLSNLVSNAVEHGGEDVTVAVGVDGDTLYVADDGPGVPAEARESVFEPGYSRGEGTGFGLAIVETIADAHGWTVSVADSRWGGARFEVTGVETRSLG